MMQKVVLVALVAGLACVSCQEIPERGRPEPTLSYVPAEMRDAVPLEYGKLFAITPVEGPQYFVVLWFQQPDETILGVQVNHGRGFIGERVLVIPRR